MGYGTSGWTPAAGAMARAVEGVATTTERLVLGGPKCGLHVGRVRACAATAAGRTLTTEPVSRSMMASGESSCLMISFSLNCSMTSIRLSAARKACEC